MSIRDLAQLPKAHLHLHLTGGMRPSTLRELAADQGIRMPDALVGEDRPELRDTVSRGWWRFQRLYDAARRVLCTADAVHRVVREAAQDEAAAGSGWMELQVDPSGYAGAFGGLVPALEVMLDAARAAESATGVGIGLVVAANRTRHPLDAATLARLATRYAEGGVIGFGLSNDESRGRPEAFEKAFRIAREAGLLAVPHGGELAGPASVARCLDTLGAHRIGHGVRVVECRETLARVADAGVTLEVCPTSNVALGVVPTAADVPLRTLVDAGIPLALGADDLLLFGGGLVEQYALARDVHGFDDTGLADLARASVRASGAPRDVKERLLDGIERWLG